MPETFLILLAGGVMLAAAVSDPRAVTLRWLRLAGIIALAVAALAIFFYARREAPISFVDPRRGGVCLIASALLILAQIAFVQVAWRRTQQALAALAFLAAVAAGTVLLRGIMPQPAAERNIAWQALACAWGAAAPGLALMDMLLGHAYLTASRMTMAPFIRLNRALAIALIGRGLLACIVAPAVQALRPQEMLWGIYGLYIGTHWLVGLAVPAVFVYMAHDCIRRRSTQSATGILYVAGVLIFIGEIIGVYLASETGLPL